MSGRVGDLSPKQAETLAQVSVSFLLLHQVFPGNVALSLPLHSTTTPLGERCTVCRIDRLLLLLFSHQAHFPGAPHTDTEMSQYIRVSTSVKEASSQITLPYGSFWKKKKRNQNVEVN